MATEKETESKLNKINNEQGRRRHHNFRKVRFCSLASVTYFLPHLLPFLPTL
jgi:hypothetical protein